MKTREYGIQWVQQLIWKKWFVLMCKSALKKHYTFPLCACAAHPHGDICSCSFTEQVAPGALSSKYGSQTENPPPPSLLFFHPRFSVPEKARNVRAEQFQPAQPEKKSTYPLLSIIYYFSLYFSPVCVWLKTFVVSSTCVHKWKFKTKEL